jgi:2-hydroxychromene-2-carboxylate isomerase
MSDADVEFFFDIGSPYSYLASTQIDQLERETGASVEWRPFLLGGVFKETGNAAPANVPPKAQYMLTDLRRWADTYDIPFQMPENFPLNTLPTQRALIAVKERGGEVPPLARALFRGYWGEGRDVSDPSVIAQMCERVDAPGDDILEAIDDDDIKAELREVTNEAVERGAFGAPTFFVDDQMFWGNDRLTFVRAAVRGD